MSTTKAIGRRLFARASMGVPLVLKGGASHPPHGGLPPIGMSAEAGNANITLASKIWKTLRVSTKDDQQQHSLRWERRSMMGGLDPDLAVLNSVSHVRRVQIQMDREKAHRDKMQGIQARIIRAMGGDPEDFE